MVKVGFSGLVRVDAKACLNAVSEQVKKVDVK